MQFIHSQQAARAFVALMTLVLLGVPAALAERAAAHARPYCEVKASYNRRYRNYDVYVHSNQPHRWAEARDKDGDQWGYYTNGNGFVDIYLYVNGIPAGRRVNVTVGNAHCSTNLS